MKLLSMVRLALIAAALCSVSAFAAHPTCMLLEGTGSMAYAEEDGDTSSAHPINYTVSLALTSMGKKNWLDYSFNVDGEITRFPVLVENAGSYSKVHVPQSDEQMDDLSSYVEAGWGMTRISNEGGGHLRPADHPGQSSSVLLTFTKGDNIYTDHTHVSRTADKKLRFLVTGTVGNGDGLTFSYTHELITVGDCPADDDGHH